jgi:hypothetical protein
MIVDEKTLVILDGMHRHDSLKKLDCIYAPCCLVDYDDPEIRVGAWFRYLSIDDSDSIAQKTLDELRLGYEKKNGVNNIDFVRPIIITKGSVFQQKETGDALYKARLAVKIEKLLTQQGFDVQYAPENTIEQSLRSGATNFIIPLPIFAKREIINIASTGQLLPHKVTRHLIPSRPLGVNVPLALLQDRTMDLREANKKLDEMLSLRQVERKPPGSIVDGRRYQEELLVFSG